MPIQKTILHIDFDSYFASCEQQFNPLLRGKSIGVTAKNGRTCIIAASRQAKKLGVKSPSRTFEALKIAPDMIFVPAHFERYWEITQKFINICKDFSPYLELFSLDEVFMDVTQTQGLFGGADERSEGARLQAKRDRRGVDEIIKRIKQRIHEEIGEYITVSVGISHNKLLAKLASGLAKPNAQLQSPERSDGGRGVFEITSKTLDEVYKTTKLTDICGIGERIALRLNKIGVYKLLELRSVSLHILKMEFGNVESEFLKNVSYGIDNSEITPYTVSPIVKSVGRSYCLPQNEYDKRIILQNLYELCEEVSIKLRRLDKKARTVGFYLSGSLKIQKRKTYSSYFDTGQEIYKHCFDLMKDEDLSNNYIRQMSIWVAGLNEKNNLQMSLFDTSKKENLIKVVDKINNKFGNHTIRNGFLLYADKLTTVPNGYMADKYERTKLSNSIN